VYVMCVFLSMLSVASVCVVSGNNFYYVCILYIGGHSMTMVRISADLWVQPPGALHFKNSV